MRRLLGSLEAATAAVSVPIETVVVDNGSVDETAALLDAWVNARPGRVALFEERANKSRALNRALDVARAPLLAFTDDDVTLDRRWLAEIIAFFAHHPEYDGAMGRVRIPPEVNTPDTAARVALYGTLPFFDRGDTVCDVTEMYGCAMVLRKHVFARIGGFDERLGPGVSGACEDTDVSKRALSTGMRLGYMPQATAFHVVDAARLTDESFVDYHRRIARSYAVMDPELVSWKSLSKWIEAACVFAMCRLLRNRRRGVGAKRRMIRHAELLRLLWHRDRDTIAAGAG